MFCPSSTAGKERIQNLNLDLSDSTVGAENHTTVHMNVCLVFPNSLAVPQRHVRPLSSHSELSSAFGLGRRYINTLYTNSHIPTYF